MGKWFRNIKSAAIGRLFPGYLQRRQDVKFGVLKFIQNFAYVQLQAERCIDLTAPTLKVSDIRVTGAAARPRLTYQYWPKKFEYKEKMPMVSVILEENRILCRDEPVGDWEVVTIDDPRLVPLHALFQAAAFYSFMRPEHKKEYDGTFLTETLTGVSKGSDA